MRRIYLDHAATTPVDKRVLKAMLPYFSEKFGNASSLHSFGREANEAIEKAREKIASLINAQKEEIYFTSGGTESNNLAIKGVAFANRERGKHIITSKIEHHAVLNVCEWLEKQGFEITYLPVDKYGFIELDKLEKAIRKDTILVSIMHANNEIGTIEPIEEIGKICRKKGVYFHTDAVQSVGKIPVDVEKMNVDLLSISSHKIYGPKGVGALYVRDGVKIETIQHGGGHEKGLRSGTENVAGIVGFGEACYLAGKEMKREILKQTKLRDYLIKNVLKIKYSRLNGHPIKRLPNNANFCFKFIEGESLVFQLDTRGIAASTGSACSSKSLEPSHVLTAIGLKPHEAHGSLRLTLGKENTKKEIDYVIKVLPEIVENLRKISPFKGKWE
ncbi:MAG: cysteine desulfurase NifS [Candidatus Parvarchaeota archaeon]|nr:cysteine desulfurase NifS [Candidatus Jingweiarchaeum tengchongense]MCW1298652.1 cysteine desulfurase NifS [Candidatus Jingweiarchaeum tengchongense]MCW1300494.1 cysteine desulfurase NifS [Candidatus Jingweiarchaeum tengchongense]MCW1304691.1 cysteine desulfurase NifS [Candidatus Jingweiarchaeum tengchongense]MCW1305880.1 cysteine desulfurase NifS [Candidatus Jingweiarchaeum tengchongense]